MNLLFLLIMRFIYFLLLNILLVLSTSFRAQTLLRLNYEKWGIHHKFDFQAKDVLIYKTWDSPSWHKNKIMAFRDSTIFFAEDYGVTFREIKKIKIKHHSFHSLLFQRLFTVGAILYPSRYLVNGLILGLPILTPAFFIVPASFITAKIILWQIGIKRVRLNEKNHLKLLVLDFERLNTP